MYARPNNSIIRYSIAGLFLLLTGIAGYWVPRADFKAVLSVYTLLFCLYAVILRYFGQTENVRFFTYIGVLARILLLFSIPNLSEDAWRFFWDGNLTTAGIHPFEQAPRYYFEQQMVVAGNTPEVFYKLNSPDYYTVYPPLSQLVFAISVWLTAHTFWGSLLLLKLVLFACELGTLSLLRKHFCHIADHAPEIKGVNPLLLYALNPLAIIEICGNVHFEGAMMYFLFAGILALNQRKTTKAGLFWAFSVAFKMIPLLFLPVIWRWIGFKRGLHFLLVFGLGCAILFLPLLPVAVKMVSGLDLYFRKFQFNASVYYLVGAIGYRKMGWDIGPFSGPLLGLLTLVLIVTIAIFTKPQNAAFKWRFSLIEALLGSILLYLSFATTVHPWYIALPLALCCFTRWRFPVLWSFLTVFSYSHYNGGAFQENYQLIGLEYILLWIGIAAEMVWRLRKGDA